MQELSEVSGPVNNDASIDTKKKRNKFWIFVSAGCLTTSYSYLATKPPVSSVKCTDCCTAGLVSPSHREKIPDPDRDGARRMIYVDLAIIIHTEIINVRH